MLSDVHSMGFTRKAHNERSAFLYRAWIQFLVLKVTSALFSLFIVGAHAHHPPPLVVYIAVARAFLFSGDRMTNAFEMA